MEKGLSCTPYSVLSFDFVFTVLSLVLPAAHLAHLLHHTARSLGLLVGCTADSLCVLGLGDRHCTRVLLEPLLLELGAPRTVPLAVAVEIGGGGVRRVRGVQGSTDAVHTSRGVHGGVGRGAVGKRLGRGTQSLLEELHVVVEPPGVVHLVGRVEAAAELLAADIGGRSRALSELLKGHHGTLGAELLRRLRGVAALLLLEPVQVVCGLRCGCRGSRSHHRSHPRSGGSHRLCAEAALLSPVPRGGGGGAVALVRGGVLGHSGKPTKRLWRSNYRAKAAGCLAWLLGC
jgi:hypothetical protein